MVSTSGRNRGKPWIWLDHVLLLPHWFYFCPCLSNEYFGRYDRQRYGRIEKKHDIYLIAKNLSQFNQESVMSVLDIIITATFKEKLHCSFQ